MASIDKIDNVSTPWIMAPTTNLLIAIQVRTHTHTHLCRECDGNISHIYHTQLRWEFFSKKWCLLPFQLIQWSCCVPSASFLEHSLNWKPFETPKSKQRKNMIVVTRSIHLNKDTPFLQVHSIQTITRTALPAQVFDSRVPCNVHQHAQAFWRDFSNFNTSASLLEDSKAANNFLRLQLVQMCRQGVCWSGRWCEEPINSQVQVQGETCVCLESVAFDFLALAH